MVVRFCMPAKGIDMIVRREAATKDEAHMWSLPNLLLPLQADLLSRVLQKWQYASGVSSAYLAGRLPS